jgi:hypothetical protein
MCGVYKDKGSTYGVKNDSRVTLFAIFKFLRVPYLTRIYTDIVKYDIHSLVLYTRSYKTQNWKLSCSCQGQGKFLHCLYLFMSNLKSMQNFVINIKTCIV